MYTIFDLIGWVFSVANVPPTRAPDNACVSLASVYARFCQILIPGIGALTPLVGVDTPPHVIAWAYIAEVALPSTGKKSLPTGNSKPPLPPPPKCLCVLLGSSLRDRRPTPSTLTKSAIQEERWKAMVKVELITDEETRFPGANSLLGHCAETWWFCVVKM